MYARKGENPDRGGRGWKNVPTEKRPPLTPCEKLPTVYRPRGYVPGARCICAAFPCICVSYRDRGKWQKAETGSRKCRRWLDYALPPCVSGKNGEDGFAHDVGTMYIYAFECRHSYLLEACVRNDDGSPVRNIKRSFDKARPSHTYTTSCVPIGVDLVVKKKRATLDSIFRRDAV